MGEYGYGNVGKTWVAEIPFQNVVIGVETIRRDIMGEPMDRMQIKSDSYI